MRANRLKLFFGHVERLWQIIAYRMHLDVHMIVKFPYVFVKRGRLGHFGQNAKILNEQYFVHGSMRCERD